MNVSAKATAAVKAAALPVLTPEGASLTDVINSTLDLELSQEQIGANLAAQREAKLAEYVEAGRDASRGGARYTLMCLDFANDCEAGLFTATDAKLAYGKYAEGWNLWANSADGQRAGANTIDGTSAQKISEVGTFAEKAPTFISDLYARVVKARNATGENDRYGSAIMTMVHVNRMAAKKFDADGMNALPEKDEAGKPVDAVALCYAWGTSVTDDDVAAWCRKVSKSKGDLRKLQDLIANLEKLAPKFDDKQINEALNKLVKAEARLNHASVNPEDIKTKAAEILKKIGE